MQTQFKNIQKYRNSDRNFKKKEHGLYYWTNYKFEIYIRHI